MKKHSQKQAAFTLVEMLVVIVIIGMLAGLLFPAVGAAIRTAKRTKAKTEVTNLVIAFGAYYTEFGYWPTNQEASFQICTNTFANSKGILFYDFTLKDVDLKTGFYQDPWKHAYWFRVDSTYNNSIPSPFADAAQPAGVLVWSMGPDEAANLSKKKTDAVNRYVITSW